MMRSTVEQGKETFCGKSGRRMKKWTTDEKVEEEGKRGTRFLAIPDLAIGFATDNAKVFTRDKK